MVFKGMQFNIFVNLLILISFMQFNTFIIMTFFFIFSKNRFKRFYVCLGGDKEGWLSRCRRSIELDGCHLRGQNRRIFYVLLGLMGTMESIH